MSNYDVIRTFSGFDYNTNNVLNVNTNTSSPISIIYTATSSGAVIGNSGYRLWDTNILSSAATANITNTSPLIFPLTTANLPPTIFDAIIDLYVDGRRTPIAFSNISDNQLISENLTDKKLFWVNLVRASPNSSSPVNNPQILSNYLFGAAGDVYSGSTSAPLLLNTNNPISNNLTFTINTTFTSYINSTTASRNNVVNVSTQGTAVNVVLVSNFLIPGFAFGGSVNGFLSISITCDDPSYCSLLPVYHWAIKNV